MGGCCVLAAVGDVICLPFLLFIFCHGVMELDSDSVDEESDTSTVMGVSESGSSLTVVIEFWVTGRCGVGGSN